MALAVALAMLLGAGGPAPPAATAAEPRGPATAEARDYDKPPPGSPADRALWQAAHDLSNDILVARATATRLQHQAKTRGYLEALEDPGKRVALPAELADDLTRRLSEEWAESMELLTAQWPVDPIRGCRYDLLNFEGVMFSDESPRKASQLDDTRKALSVCVARGTGPLRALQRSNEELRATLVAVERALASARASAAPGAGPAAPAAPAASK